MSGAFSMISRLMASPSSEPFAFAESNEEFSPVASSGILSRTREAAPISLPLCFDLGMCEEPLVALGECAGFPSSFLGGFAPINKSPWHPGSLAQRSFRGERMQQGQLLKNT